MANQKRQSFHHGNLREALLQASLSLLDSGGPEGVTIRAVARETGVSHAAPVNHFKDREALLTGLAVQLFGGRSRFFGVGRVLLRDLIELRYAGVDLFDALGLLAAGRGDLVDQVVDLARALGDLI